MQISLQVRNHIFALEEGELFTTSELLSYVGSCGRGAVDQTLNRLIRRGVIVRVASGVFMRETACGWRPSFEEIIQARTEARAYFGAKELSPSTKWECKQTVTELDYSRILNFAPDINTREDSVDCISKGSVLSPEVPAGAAEIR